jgi:hypothetical protein
VQADENRTKPNAFHLFSFSFRNRAFSMGYDGKNKKNLRPIQLASLVVRGMSQTHALLTRSFLGEDEVS